MSEIIINSLIEFHKESALVCATTAEEFIKNTALQSFAAAGIECGTHHLAAMQALMTIGEETEKQKSVMMISRRAMDFERQWYISVGLQHQN